MTTKKQVIIAVVILIVAFALLYPILAQNLKQQRVNINPSDTNLKEVVCDIQVTNPRGIPLVKNGDLVIESAACAQQPVKNCGRFGIFSDKGSLSLEAAGGLGSATDISISEGSTQSYTLSWCGSMLTKRFNAKLFNANNENIQTKEVRLI